jgi:hypothetical protein
MEYGKTTMASRTTSVPEVAGATVYYVDPFSIESIYKGFEYLDFDENIKRLEKYIRKRNEIIKQLSLQDSQILVDEIIKE